MSIPDLGKHVRRLGFHWIELPVRPGFPCRPEAIEQDLPRTAKILADYDINILSIASSLSVGDESLYAACAETGVGVNRVMMRRHGQNYWVAEKRAREDLDAALPLCEQYNVQIGIQNHSGDFVAVNAMGLWNLVRHYPSRYVGAIWDAAHNAIAGMDPEAALDVVESHLCMINLKNAYFRKLCGHETRRDQWMVHWTIGKDGLASWHRVATRVKSMNYTGPICLTAEYSDRSAVDRLIQEDLAYAQALFK